MTAKRNLNKVSQKFEPTEFALSAFFVRPFVVQQRSAFTSGISILSPSLPIYLDHHATTPLDPRVFEVMKPWLTERFGNAASLSHRYGDEARQAVETARQQIADFLTCDTSEVIFTSGATESNNLALKGILWSSVGDGQFIINRGEHRAILDPADRLARSGYQLKMMDVDSTGQINPDQIREAMTPKTRLVSAMWANNEVGTINPIEEIGEICRENHMLFHTDAVQGVGLLPVNFRNLSVDLLSLTAHKIYGPQGIGALIVRRDRGRIPLTPLIDGGGHERHLRSGTLPVALIAGFGEACRITGEAKNSEAMRLASLRDRLWSGLQSQLPGIHRNGHPTQCLPNNLNVSFEGVDGDALMAGMTEIAVSSGSACTSANPEPSHVLKAMGVSDFLTRASLRFGLGRSTTEEQIDHAINHVIDVVSRLRNSIASS